MNKIILDSGAPSLFSGPPPWEKKIKELEQRIEALENKEPPPKPKKKLKDTIKNARARWERILKTNL